eukprot:CAMPEP_0182425364 /NCGR_PEP_ID=MMETSP1167-20130531/11775_1 /TAXON_ID=2988 /ORGANISM="Mallomonas Sp, Strain CCMP3275" /LENGTH=679 /DNA_ID=CAMNT_0024606011 /DNA_START=12 /DNA_END=2051 /DNA_ORIENTATION=-
MEKIQFIVERLNQPPFNKGISTLTELDSKSSLELIQILCEIIIEIDPEQEPLNRENTENRVYHVLNFLSMMKFNIPEGQFDEFRDMMLAGDKDVLHDVMFWCLQRFDHLQKRAYLGKYLMPVDIPAEYLNDERVVESMDYLKEMQANFKEIHRSYDQMQNTGVRPAELRAEISQLEAQITQLNSKISRLKKDSKGDQNSFNQMLKVTSFLRKEQEEEAHKQEKLREQRAILQDTETRVKDATRRFQDVRSSGSQSQSAEQLLSSLQKQVREQNDIKERLDSILNERISHYERIQSWEQSDRVTTEDDVRAKKKQLQEMNDETESVRERLEAALERNSKLTVFRQACAMSLSKLREKENDVERLNEDKRRLLRQIEERESSLRAQGKGSVKADRMDKKKYSAQVREKIEKYKKLREQLSAYRAEAVILQRTEQILKSRHKNLDEFLVEMERKKGVEGYRDTQRTLVEMSERTAEVDQLKGETLEHISAIVEKTIRDFKDKQSQLQPLMTKLKALRQEYMEVEAEHVERRGTYDKVAVGLEVEKQSLEKECDQLQEECLREETRYHTLNCMLSISRQKLERAEQEKRWRNGDGRMLRDFSCLKDLYTHKSVQQEQLTKQLRNQTKILKESSSVMSNQKTLFRDLAQLLDAKMRTHDTSGRGASRGYDGMNYGNSDVMMMGE